MAALASRSDDVASALTAGDTCRALGLARRLQQDTVAAINRGNIPGAFQEQLGSTVGDLVSRIRCVPAESKHDNGKHKTKHEGKHKKRGERD